MSYRDPEPEDLKRPEFEAVWQAIKKWDVNVPEAYNGYCGATGNHVMVILDAITPVLAAAQEEIKRYREALQKIVDRKLEDLPGDKHTDEFHKTLMATAAWIYCGFVAKRALEP